MKKGNQLRRILSHKYIYLMMLPGLIAYFCFSYLPLYGMIMAFQNFSIAAGFFKSEWAGLTNFLDFFNSNDFSMTMKSTLSIGILRIIFSFPAPIVFSLFLNELKEGSFKKISQTASYLPHFVSWATIGAIILSFLSVDGGPLNEILMKIGIVDTPVHFAAKGEAFWPILIISDIWRELGWNTIFYLAVMAMIDKELYESSIVDGAGKFRQIVSITLPGITPAIAIMLVLNIGNIVNANATDLFNQIMVLRNDVIREYSDVLDVFVYQQGLKHGLYSYASAIGIFKSIISVSLVFLSNTSVKKINADASLL